MVTRSARIRPAGARVPGRPRGAEHVLQAERAGRRRESYAIASGPTRWPSRHQCVVEGALQKLPCLGAFAVTAGDAADRCAISVAAILDTAWRLPTPPASPPVPIRSSGTQHS